MEQNRELEINHTPTKDVRIYNGEKMGSAVSGAGKTGQLHVKEQDQNISSHHLYKKTKKKMD